MIAQEENIISFNPDTLLDIEYIDLNPYVLAFQDTLSSRTMDQLDNVTWESYDSVRNRLEKGPYQYPLWIKVNIQPERSLGDKEVSIRVNGSSRTQTFEIRENQMYRSKGGNLMNYNKTHASFCKFVYPLRILDTVPRTFLIRIAGTRLKIQVQIWNTEESLKKHSVRHIKNRLEYHYWIGLSSLLLFLGIFFIIRYIQIPESFLLYYGIYLICLSIQFIVLYEQRSETPVFWNWIPYGFEISKMMGGITYTFFGIHIIKILNLQKSSLVYRLCIWLIGLLIITVSLHTIELILYHGFHISFQLLYKSIPYLFILASLFCIIIAIQILLKKDRLHLLVGLSLLVLSLGITTTLLFLQFGKIGPHYHLIAEFSAIIDVLLLTMAIGYKMKKANDDLLITQQQLLDSETQKLQIQQQLNSELSSLVEEKTKDILEKNQALAKEEKLKLEAEFNQKIANAELKALKAQMNPHFIFNCLNAIRNLVQKNNNHQATDYLSDFSTFIRTILNYSEEKQISLEEELQLCELYLKMEQLRFEQEFNYSIQVADHIPTDFIMVPPMILQPLLENAIWHGLRHKVGNRDIQIQVFPLGDQVICSIRDNGVGRAFTTTLGKVKSHKSFGMKLFHERLGINNQLYQNQYHYEIIDKYEGEQSTGTEVKLYFEL